jgi:hypothetical protein
VREHESGAKHGGTEDTEAGEGKTARPKCIPVSGLSAFASPGQHGSIAVVERVILTIKCLLSCLPLVPYRREAFLKELTATVEWYNQSRPHTWLGGRTPNEVYFGAFPANRRPRFEPRSRWPRGSPCAKPWALVRGSAGVKLTLEVSFHRGSRHLPLVALKRVA